MQIHPHTLKHKPNLAHLKLKQNISLDTQHDVSLQVINVETTCTILLKIKFLTEIMSVAVQRIHFQIEVKLVENNQSAVQVRVGAAQ